MVTPKGSRHNIFFDLADELREIIEQDPRIFKGTMAEFVEEAIQFMRPPQTESRKEEETMEQGDHDCQPTAPCFLTWFRENYVWHGPCTFSDIERAWRESEGYWLPPDMLEAALQMYLDTGDVLLDSTDGHWLWRPAGTDADLRTAAGLAQQLGTAIQMATERKWGKIEL